MPTSGLAPLRGAVDDQTLFRWSPRTPTTGYFLATLRVAPQRIANGRPDPILFCSQTSVCRPRFDKLKLVGHQPLILLALAPIGVYC